MIGCLASVWLLAGCGGEQASADEVLVCDTVQGLVDDLSSERSEAAISRLPSLKQAVTDTTNPRLSAAGSEFFDQFFTDIDYTQLTVQQTAELGQQYQASMGALLGEILTECAQIGRPIERLPQ